MKTYMANDHTTTVKYLPVCTYCGYVFKEDIHFKEEIIETGLGLKYPTRKYIIPSFCPECNRYIERAEWRKPIVIQEEIKDI